VEPVAHAHVSPQRPRAGVAPVRGQASEVALPAREPPQVRHVDRLAADADGVFRTSGPVSCA
jgi:hypothetical protein